MQKTHLSRTNYLIPIYSHAISLVIYGLSTTCSIIFANSIEKLPKLPLEISQASLKVGLSMNLKETKVIYNEFSEEIEEVAHYFYLGRFWFFRNKDIPITSTLKRQLYDRCIFHTVTCGSETLNLTKQQTLKLRTLQRAHEWIMINITWWDRKTAKLWIREKTKLWGYHGNDR